MADSPHEKSIKFLRGICTMDGIELVNPDSAQDITVRVRGRSGRHYEIVASSPLGNFFQETWQTEVRGAAWKRDFNTENTRSYTAKLCLNIHEDKEHLPIGDRLASLALSLYNDIKLAMDIALVAQFIVCPREDLLNIHIFQDEMVMTEEMFQQGVIDMNIDEDENFEYCEFFENSWLYNDSDAPLELEASRDNWAQDIEYEIIQRYERANG